MLNLRSAHGLPELQQSNALKLHGAGSQRQLHFCGPDTNQRERAELQRPEEGEEFPHSSSEIILVLLTIAGIYRAGLTPSPSLHAPS